MFDVMIRFEVQVLVGVGWFSVHDDMSTAVVIDVYTGVQEGEDPVAFWFGCENNVRVNTVDMSCELLYVVFMDLGERVIHVPQPQGWRVRCSAQSSFFEHLHVQVLAREEGWFKRKIREAIEIKTLQPTINRDQGFDLPAIYSEILPVSVTRDRSHQTSGHPAQAIGAVASSSQTKET